MSAPNFYEQVYAVVRRIPRGRVTSYGRVARMLGRPNAARAVGYALGALGDRQRGPHSPQVPWYRVINSVGRISTPNTDGGAETIETVPVTIGLRDNRYTQITGGLAEGDVVQIGDALPVQSFGPPTVESSSE